MYIKRLYGIISILLSALILFVLSSCRVGTDPTGSIPLQNENSTESAAADAEELTDIFVSDEKVIVSNPPVNRFENTPETTNDIDQILTADEICKTYGAVGVQIAILRNGKLSGTYEFGYADMENNKKVSVDTKFRVASLSKLPSDMVFMALVDKKQVDENADISRYLGYEVRNPSYPFDVITPKMLMTHTSSLVDSSRFLDSRQNHSSVPAAELLQSGSSFSSYRPGYGYNYCNFNVAVIGMICEQVTGRFFYDLSDEYLFDKIGIDAAYTAKQLRNCEDTAVLYGNGGYSIARQMSESFCDKIGQTHHLVQGNLTISAKDYAEILSVLLNGGKTDSGIRILSEESVEKILTDYYETGSEGMGYGLWFTEQVIKGEYLAVHTGSNFGMFSSFAISPKTGDGVVVLTSGAQGSRDDIADMPVICLELIRLFW